MSTHSPYDLILRNVRLIRPLQPTVESVDIAVRGGKIAAVAPRLETSQAAKVIDGS